MPPKMIAFKGTFATIFGYLDGFGIVSNHNGKVEIYWCTIDLFMGHNEFDIMAVGLPTDDQLIEQAFAFSCAENSSVQMSKVSI